MGIKGIFSKKDKKDSKDKSNNNKNEDPKGFDALKELNVKTEELTKDKCKICNNTFKNGDDAYKCHKCGLLYHFPDCLKKQTECQSCGKGIIEKDNIVKLIKFKQVVCPKCKKKVKLDFSIAETVQVNCPNCKSKGEIPNPYLKELKIEKEPPKEKEKEEKKEKEKKDKKDKKSKGKEEKKEEPEEQEEKIIKPSEVEGRKPKLTVLKKSITCHVCLGSIKTGLPVVVCKCGKKFHETCANRVGFCPICESDLTDYEPEGELAEELLKDRKKQEVEIDMEIEVEEEPEPEPKIEQEVQELEEVEVEAEAEPEPEEEPEPEPEPEEEPEPEPEPEPEEEPEEEPEPEPEPELEVIPRLELNSENTFDNYKIDDHNRIIYNITHGIAEAPGQEFNLIYMYGGKGMGKTHLLHAIGNFIQKNNADLNISYTSTKQLFEDLKEAHSNKKLKDLEDEYLKTDVILLEDFQEIPKAKAGQDVVFNIFENFMMNKKQIVLTGDRPIEDIKSLQKNLTEKFKDASIIKIIQQSRELRKEILKKEVSSVFEMVDELIEEGDEDVDLDSLKAKLAEMIKTKKDKGKKK